MGFEGSGIGRLRGVRPGKDGMWVWNGAKCSCLIQHGRLNGIAMDIDLPFRCDNKIVKFKINYKNPYLFKMYLIGSHHFLNNIKPKLYANDPFYMLGRVCVFDIISNKT